MSKFDDLIVAANEDFDIDGVWTELQDDYDKMAEEILDYDDNGVTLQETYKVDDRFMAVSWYYSQYGDGDVQIYEVEPKEVTQTTYVRLDRPGRF